MFDPAPHHHFKEINPCKSIFCEGFFFSNTHCPPKCTPNLLVQEIILRNKVRLGTAFWSPFTSSKRKIHYLFFVIKEDLKKDQN